MFYVGKKEYHVYKITERDEHTRNCNADIVSPDFGFLYGTGTFSSARISKHSDNKTISELIEKIKYLG